MANALRWLKLPYWAIQLLTGAKSFVGNPLIGSARLNRAGLHRWRLRLSHRLSARRRASLADLLPADLRAQADRDGCVEIRDFLPADQFKAIRDALYAQAWPAREMIQGDTITRRIAVNPAMLRAVPALHGLISHKVWRGLTRYLSSFACEPLLYIQTIVTHVRDAAPDPQVNLHADTFQPTMKAWLFLDDVAMEDGPFAYVKGSHRLTPERLAWEDAKASGWRSLDRLSQRGSLRVTEPELATLGLPAPTRFAVPANTLVIGDTCGFHGRSPASRPSVRIELWAYQRRNPFLPFIGFDLLGRPGIAERRVDFWWRMNDRLRRFGIGRQPWQPVGDKTPQQR